MSYERIELREWFGEPYEVLVELSNVNQYKLDKMLAPGGVIAGVVEKRKSERGVELTLDFFGEKEFWIPLVNNTSDVEEEHYSVETDGMLVRHSILMKENLVCEVVDDWFNSNTTLSLEEFYQKECMLNKWRSKIFDRLNELGVKVNFMNDEIGLDTDSGRHLYIGRINCLPIENLNKLYNCVCKLDTDCSQKISFGDVLVNASKNGLLKFKPYYYRNVNGKVTLALKYNRFVHLFKEEYFQCSYSEYGYGAYSTASVNLKFLTQKFREFGLGESKALKYMYYINLIACCWDMEDFRLLLKNEPCIVDNFIRESVQGIFEEWDVTFEEMLKDMVAPFDCSNNELSPIAFYRIPSSATSDWGRVKIYSGTCVGVEVWNELGVSETIYTLPNVMEGAEESFKKLAEDLCLSVEDRLKMVSIRLDNMNCVRKSIINFALNMNMFVTNNLITYPISPRQDRQLRALNLADVPVIEGLSVLDRSSTQASDTFSEQKHFPIDELWQRYH